MAIVEAEMIIEQLRGAQREYEEAELAETDAKATYIQARDRTRRALTRIKRILAEEAHPERRPLLNQARPETRTEELTPTGPEDNGETPLDQIPGLDRIFTELLAKKLLVRTAEEFERWEANGGRLSEESALSDEAAERIATRIREAIRAHRAGESVAEPETSKPKRTRRRAKAAAGA